MPGFAVITTCAPVPISGKWISAATARGGRRSVEARRRQRRRRASEIETGCRHRRLVSDLGADRGVGLLGLSRDAETGDHPEAEEGTGRSDDTAFETCGMRAASTAGG